MSEEQKPVAWTTLEELQDLQNYTHSSMWGEKVWPDEVDYIALYLHPAPAVVKQLVEALEKITQVDAGSPVKTYQEMEDIAKAALEVAKEVGL